MDVQVRDAVPEDAAEAAHVMRCSIKDLCIADHHNDERLIADWTGNKTEPQVRRWIESPANWAKVAVRDDQVIGMATLNDQGTVLLMYVLPEEVRRGIGSQLMAAVEAHGRRAGLNSLNLESTATAKPFYERSGFTDVGEPLGADTGMPCFPMTKQL